MIAADIVKSLQTKGAALIDSVLREDGTFKFGVLYRKLNAVASRDSYPMPRVDECNEALGQVAKFSTLERSSGY